MKRIFTINTIVRILILAGLVLVLVTAFAHTWYSR
jgi:hypothetical protein